MNNNQRIKLVINI